MAQQWSMKWFNEFIDLYKEFDPGWIPEKNTLANGSTLNFVPCLEVEPFKSVPLFQPLTFPIKHPSAAALISTFDNADRKEPQMSSEQPKSEVAVNHEKSTLETRNHDARVAHAMDTIARAINDVFEDVHWADANQNELGRALDQNAALRARNIDLEHRLANQRATIENYQGRILELEQRLDLSEGAHQLTAEGAHRGSQASVAAEAGLKAQLERALHTQKVLERDLEEYQQAYADLKEAAFGDGGPADEEGELPPRLLEFGHGEYLVYPAKVCSTDDDQDPQWGIIVDPATPHDDALLKPLVGKDVVLTDGDVAITFQKPDDVARLIHTLEDLRYRMITEEMFVQEK